MILPLGNHFVAVTPQGVMQLWQTFRQWLLLMLLLMWGSCYIVTTCSLSGLANRRDYCSVINLSISSPSCCSAVIDNTVHGYKCRWPHIYPSIHTYMHTYAHIHTKHMLNTNTQHTHAQHTHAQHTQAQHAHAQHTWRHNTCTFLTKPMQIILNRFLKCE